MLLHLESADPTRSRCGKYHVTLTTDKNEVTCGSCSRNYSGQENPRAAANRKARLMPGYADSNFTGTGKLSCHLCGRPIRDHPRWPCDLRVL